MHCIISPAINSTVKKSKALFFNAYGGFALKILFVFAASLFVLSGELSTICAQKYLTGELSGSYPAGEYIVSGNIHVLPRTRLSFDPGSILRFENYTGIVVRGELVCIGTSLKPVVFTSSRDVPSSHTMPEAFDWNGIKVTSEASGITFENCVVSYSTFGLNIESNETPVSIKAITFNNNGSASLTREKKMMPVTDNLGVSFVWPEILPPATISDTSSKDSSVINQKIHEKKKHKGKTAGKIQAAKPKFEWKPVLRITTGSAAAIGGIVWICGYELSSKYGHQQKVVYHHYLADNVENPDWLAADKNYKKWLTVQNLGIGLFCAGTIGFSVTFLFK